MESSACGLVAPRKLRVLVKAHGFDHLHGQSIAAKDRGFGFKSYLVVIVRGTALDALESQDIRIFWKDRNLRCCLVQPGGLECGKYGEGKNNGYRGHDCPSPLP